MPTNSISAVLQCYDLIAPLNYGRTVCEVPIHGCVVPTKTLFPLQLRVRNVDLKLLIG